jgi:hypothetical protein
MREKCQKLQMGTNWEAESQFPVGEVKQGRVAQEVSASPAQTYS